MTQDDKQFLGEFLRGAGIVVAVVGMFILFIVLSNQTFKPSQPTEPTVVDTYKGCDVVRWSTSSMSEYKYFLHCNNTRPVYGQ